MVADNLLIILCLEINRTEINPTTHTHTHHMTNIIIHTNTVYIQNRHTKHGS
jgi:hypothetical protein